MKISIFIYFLLACFISWSFKFIISGETLGWLSSGIPRGILQLGAACGPSLAGLIVIIVIYGKKGLSSLLNSLTSFNIGAKWYIFAIFIELLMFMCVVGFAYATNFRETNIRFNMLGSSIKVFITGFLILSITTGLAEEIGWRGFLLPRMLSMNKLIISLIIFSLLNSLWHLRTSDLTMLLSGNTKEFFLSYLPEILQRIMITIPVTFIIVWLFNKTKGSLVIMIIFHGASNASWEWVKEITGNSDPSYLLSLWTIMLWITMIVVVPALVRQKRNNELITLYT